ncbi:SAICAR synthetase [Allosaccharopolyspora coralli]|uniref:SAICAR synthetase n=1 Tax=Allosaccharopolyspora coralli TaxID=2665642 RepID=A0A5Q3Q9Y2_9PSEU|nr:phosphoribosylaminoimidazolesuccinocarboxamide synthase [Allosaccharopolyspora coralli]QGK70004.1 SAICAR synthetase [Allosaccharopolyspora coralli]
MNQTSDHGTDTVERLSPETLSQLVQQSPDVEGRSKKLWMVGESRCVTELVPSLRSYTYERDELVDGTAELRLDFYETVADWIEAAGVRTAFVRRLDKLRYLAEYRPASPFEVIVKNVATGSTTKKYPGLFDEGHRFSRPVVKFDYRIDPEDQPIGEDYLAELGVPVVELKDIALRCNTVLTERLAPLDLWDFCLVIGQDAGGYSIISEISPDCMRLKGPDGHSWDKDLFRHGADGAQIRQAWQQLIERVS